jgi:hypothetical protein
LYSVTQIFQVIAIFLAPFLYRRIGLARGIALTQIGTGCLLYTLSHTTNTYAAIAVFLAMNAVQWMSGPGIAALLMNNIDVEDRSHAAATLRQHDGASQLHTHCQTSV